ncbi:DUF1684 domain-containing protein [Myroides sp. LJL119]
MKKLLFFISICLLTISCDSSKSQLDIAQDFQKNLNKEFSNSKTSPLPKDALKTFSSLEFFPISEKYIFSGKLKLTPDEKPFEMLTTTNRRPFYKKYGEITFVNNNVTYTLDVFQDLTLIQEPEYKDNLFLPFTDLTSGVTSYGGGRYLNLTIPETDQIIINFNTAYNPYCVYNPKYSCPVPPQQNFLNFEVNAGVKDYSYQ